MNVPSVKSAESGSATSAADQIGVTSARMALTNTGRIAIACVPTELAAIRKRGESIGTGAVLGRSTVSDSRTTVRPDAGSRASTGTSRPSSNTR
jgi:hypothetical protein